ncbi:MAG: helix-turn-helix domain-containing protein [Halorhodospira sp.]
MSERSQKSDLPSLGMMATVASIRAGRALLGWSQKELARRSGVSVPALNRLERLDSEPRLETVVRLEEALYEAGVRKIAYSDGRIEMTVEPRAIEEIRERLAAGGSVTSRGRVRRPQKEDPKPE